MDRAVSEWLVSSSLPRPAVDALTKKLNKSYTIYGSMLLLPQTAFEGPEWQDLPARDQLYKSICTHLKITHIAVNKPIPLQNHTSETPDFNVLRSPTNFQPLHGDFGPEVCSDPPTTLDFEKGYWVTAKQNGIYQTWAPRWTMFSRGNISEKARLLTLPSVLRAVDEGECAAVDLYAGIGYFAFSYAKAGVRQVLCWDLNPWSCEGLRRGAKKNKWDVAMRLEDDWEEARFVVFNESNERAPERVAALRERLPPIRHVNCGMLAHNLSDSLKLAARVLDSRHDGWLHMHQNILVEEIVAKSEETRIELKSILKGLRQVDVGVEVEYINRLKSYAPGVMHCVIDILVHASDPP